jgi:hypothetical protein
MGANTPRMPERVSRDIDTRIARIVNPVILNVAGTGCYSVSLLKHVGRRSGREYATPVAAFPLGDGFVFALLYGDLATVDWCRNVMASGECTLKALGREYILKRPEMISASDALAAYPRLWKYMLKTRGINQFLWVHGTSQESE